MSETLKAIRTISDPTRVRILSLLYQDELSVNELQEITGMGQSRISTHLSQLQESSMIQSRKDGKRTFYRLADTRSPLIDELIQLGLKGTVELPESNSDSLNLKRILERRNNQAQLLFNQVAGRFDRSYGPGRSWQAFGNLLLRILPPMIIADLGSGEGLLSELLALNAEKVIAVDNSEKIIAYATEKTRKNGIDNLEFRLGDLQNPPIDDSSIDLVVLSQALHHAKQPKTAIGSAFKILKAGGRIMILDLANHQFKEAESLYGDRWLGFKESELHAWLEEEGFQDIEITMVAREEDPPHFQTLLAAGTKPASC